MGAQCLSTTPNEVYKKYFEGIKVSELKDHWSTVKVYKIKKIYDKACQKHPEYSKHTHLPYEKFVDIFPELRHYQQIHKKRIFEIFDRDNQGFLDWSNFYSSISICYFADLKSLGALMFMIFDDTLSKQLSSQQLRLMLQLNQSYILQQIENDEAIPMFLPQDIHHELLKKGNTIKNSITVDQWLDKMDQFFDINRFRSVFNVFIEEKLEKQLIQNFNQWNSLYNEREERYISYLISYKWFESWKIYVLEAYGKNLSPNARNPTTKTIKTKKSFKNNKDTKSKNKLATSLHLRQLKFSSKANEAKKAKRQSQYEEGNVLQQLKNFDFIHSNIGERPRQIYNNVLEGEFQQVLKPELVQNRDYVLVSDKVWEGLRAIYEGFPQFRRTGYDFIELYPKVLKIYSQLFKGKIDYSSEIMRQVSSYLTLEQLLTKSIEIPQDKLGSKTVFYKTIGMPRWQEITDLTYMFTQITPQLIIFLVYIDKSEVQAFKKNHHKIPKQIVQVNVGDKIVYHDITNGMKVQKNLLFMGKNTEGKYVLHTPGESYIYDFTVMEEQLYKKGAIVNGKNLVEDVKMKKKTDLQIIGIANTKGIGFVNSVILNLFAIKNFRDNISFIKCSSGQITKIIQVLTHVNSLISGKKKVDARDILDMVEILLPDFQNFEIGMCYNFMNQFLRIIQSEFAETGLKDLITLDFHFRTKKAIKCGKCKKLSQTVTENFLLSVPIPENSEKYYEVIYVPYCQNFRPLQIKRYGFTLPQNATFQKYKETFQKLAQITSERYIMAEVYNNNIIKNYSTVKQDATLSSIYLRDTDTIYAFELCIDFDRFISEHYTSVKDICNKDFKIDQFVDCKNEQRGWIFGKISEIEFLPYTHRTVFRVIHKFSKNEQWQISYDLYQGGIASFPTKSYLNAQQYHIRLLQRYFNEPSNEMQLCNIPLVVVLTNWMRWKQFYYLIYLQVKRFIADQHKFKDQEQEEGNMQIYSSKTLYATNQGGKSPKKNQSKKIKLNKFKEYLYGQSFPYVLNFVDRDGRCAICFKFLKTRVLKGQADSYCEGCVLSFAQPISWQIKASDVMICIDWKNLSKMKKKIVKDHSSYANLLMYKKNDIQNLEKCVNNKLGQKYTEQIENFCCNTAAISEINERIINNPNNLIIYLQRVVQEDGFKKIMNKQVNFETDDYTFNGETYKLMGLTSINGGNKNIQYKTYVLNADQDWIQYDGQLAKVVKKSVVQKVCAFTLYYRKKSIQYSKQIEKQKTDMQIEKQEIRKVSQKMFDQKQNYQSQKYEHNDQ